MTTIAEVSSQKGFMERVLEIIGRTIVMSVS